MFQSVFDDIRYQMNHGNMIVKIIFVNLFVFFAMIVVKAFSPGGGQSEGFQTILSWVSLSSDPMDLIRHPLSILSHMFLHVGLWHILWNMLMLYWFGKIVGDLIGDQRILPLYLMGGLAGAMAYLLFANLTSVTGMAYGASAAVMALVVASGFLAPEYNMRLLLIGDVKLKYIVFALVLLDIVMIAESDNTGGRMAHLGGSVFGGLYVYLLGLGSDLAAPINQLGDRVKSQSVKYKSSMKVIYKDQQVEDQTEDAITHQDRVDEILDKINQSGFDSLNEEEKEFLYQASKK